MNKALKARVWNKYGGRCAYTGRPLGKTWQVDHLMPKIQCRFFPEKDPNHIDNLMPALRIVNHYKRCLSLEKFRTWYLGGLHERLKKLPKNPYSPNSIRRKCYLLEVAEVFGITEDKPFSGKFYFEQYDERTRN